MLKGFKATENPDEYIRIGQDSEGNETSRVRFNIHKHPGYEKELDDFIANNGVVEEAETAEELAAREAKEFQDALTAQDKHCENLLIETDKKMAIDWPYPDDQPAWAIYRSALRAIIGCGEIRTIPTKPFGD